jgi:hypothetical protein
MARVHADDVDTCASVDFEPSGDVVLCGRPFGHWNGRSLVAAGDDLFALDGDDLVINGKHTMRIQAGEIVAITPNLTPDLRFHVTPAGEVIDGAGKHTATIRPAPRDLHVALAALAAVENGAVLQAVAGVLTFGKGNPCACPRPER